ncbi:hypothetical protein [Novosphingobium humi]|uniref:Uncharacterized protein n=1 Tax=Novosphingobium humi TaxID=2282397 RepID=A0ABY7TZF1_9SPHN|nr:hypothetical protein [Novosphingobium humi]WCT78650.1 hypothetical protein PQ457_06720 [Novosphingobium humi]
MSEAESGGSVEAGKGKKRRPPTPLQLAAKNQLEQMGDLKARLLNPVLSKLSDVDDQAKGRKHKRGKAFPKAPKTSPLQRAAQDRRRCIDSAYSVLHAGRANEERELAAQHSRARGLYGHRRNGTVETHQAAATMRQGALARLHRSGAISNDQLGWALEIQAEHERIDADVTVRSASLETRVDLSVCPDAAFFESLGRVRRAMAYSRWRRELPTVCADCLTGAQHVLAMVVDDLGVTWAARRLRMSVRRTRKVLLDALDMWPGILEEVRGQVDEKDLLLAHRRIGVY